MLCNNAGLPRPSPTLSTARLEEWDATFAVNTRGVFLGTKYALPHMLAQRHGAIVNTASVAGLVGLKDRAAYCASKGAVIAFTRQVAIQYAGTGVRATASAPAPSTRRGSAACWRRTTNPSGPRPARSARQPMGRLGTPRRNRRAALYLASDAAAFITGSELVIDGGLLAG